MRGFATTPAPPMDPLPPATPMMVFVPALLALGAGLVAGVFFAFSNFVMKALGQLPADQGVAAMQRINVVVLNPAFLALFVGTAAVAGLCGAGAVLAWGSVRAALLLAAAVLSLLGQCAAQRAARPAGRRFGRGRRLVAGLPARMAALEPCAHGGGSRCSGCGHLQPGELTFLSPRGASP
jgi:hypothetical protein